MSGSLTAARRDNKPAGAKDLRLLTHREQVLDEMLDHYNEAQEPCYSGGSSGDGTGVIGMPRVWNDSYRELERTLRRMQGLDETTGAAGPGFRRIFWHLCEWYLRCTKIPKVSEPKTVRRGGELVELPRTVRLHIVRKGEPTLVLLGLEWIGLEFVGEPFLPSEILEPVAA